MNQWFRMYAEFSTDPKIRTMSDVLQIRLVRLFCLRSSGLTEKLSYDELKYGIGCNDDETFLETKLAFQAKGFIDENWAVLNWNKRQFVSDSSTERVNKFRAKQALKQSETFLKRDETQNETHQNRTEQNRIEQKKTIARSVPPEEPAGTLPLLGGDMYEISKQQMAEWQQAFPGVDVKSELKRTKVWMDANPTRKKTPKGINRAIVSWLTRSQDSGRTITNGGTNGKQTGKIESNLEILAACRASLENNGRTDGSALLSRGADERDVPQPDER